MYFFGAIVLFVASVTLEIRSTTLLLGRNALNVAAGEVSAIASARDRSRAQRYIEADKVLLWVGLLAGVACMAASMWLLARANAT